MLANFIITSASAQADYNNYQKPNEATLKQQLTPMQYNVTQQQGTEPLASF